jgi:pre-mRNA-splicing factor ISY1
MFNRWVTGKQTAIAGGPKGRRPYLASECRDLDQADKWRQEILREIGKLVMEIQNEGLGEHRLRDMNDQINKLTREKHHWEKQIIKLGGPNYIAQGRRAMDEAAQEGFVDGMDQRGGGGGGPVYRYYGAAKNLPGVKELFQKPEKRTVRRTRAQMYRNIDMDYYGMRDDDDGVLIKLEAEATEKARAEAVAEWEAEQARREADGGKRRRQQEDDDFEALTGGFKAYVPLPDNKDIEALVLAKKKKDLLAKYASPALQEQEAEAKAMLNKE